METLEQAEPDVNPAFWAGMRVKLQSPNESDLMASLIAIRLKVSTNSPPIEEVVGAGLVPLLVGFLETSSIRIQQEASWILINVAFGSTAQAESIFAAGGIVKLLRLLDSPDPVMAKQCAWILSNLCGDGRNFRDVLLAEGLVGILERLLRAPILDMKLIQTRVWLSLNISRNSSLSLSSVRPLFAPLLDLLVHHDRKLLVDISWFFSNLATNGVEVPVDALASVLSRFQPILYRDDIYVVESTLNMVCNISMIPASNKRELIVRAGMINKIISLIPHPKKIISRLAAMTCRNVAMTYSHVITRMFEGGLSVNLKALFESPTAGWKAQREAIWMIRNIYRRGSYNNIHLIIGDDGVLKSMIGLLRSKNSNVVTELLKLLDTLLGMYLTYDEMDIDLHEKLVAWKLDEEVENLLDHASDDIHSTARLLLEEHFPDKLPYDPSEYGQAEE